MPDPVLTSFVETSLRHGAARTEVRDALSAAGWSADQIEDALGSFADIDFVVPVPRPKAQVSARDAFLYLVAFGMLYLSAYNLGDLLFQFIHLAFPDELEPRTEYIYPQIRWATSAIVVSFPIFLYVSYRITRDTLADPTRRTSSVRRWLTYLTLFVAASIIVGDLIWLVYNLLSGDLTVRFLLKTLVVGLIAGSIFGYYLWSMNADNEALRR